MTTITNPLNIEPVVSQITPVMSSDAFFEAAKRADFWLEQLAGYDGVIHRQPRQNLQSIARISLVLLPVIMRGLTCLRSWSQTGILAHLQRILSTGFLASVFAFRNYMFPVTRLTPRTKARRMIKIFWKLARWLLDSASRTYKFWRWILLRSKSLLFLTILFLNFLAFVATAILFLVKLTFPALIEALSRKSFPFAHFLKILDFVFSIVGEYANLASTRSERIELGRKFFSLALVTELSENFFRHDGLLTSSLCYGA